MAPDVLRCDLGTKNCASATLFKHTAADPDVGINIFMFQSANRAMAGDAAARGFHCLIR